MAYETLLYDVDGAIATVTLNRPDNLNAFDTSLRREFIGAAREVNKDDDIRVVVLTGAGRAFSAGADLAEAGAGDEPGEESGEEVGALEPVGGVEGLGGEGASAVEAEEAGDTVGG